MHELPYTEVVKSGTIKVASGDHRLYIVLSKVKFYLCIIVQLKLHVAFATEYSICMFIIKYIDPNYLINFRKRFYVKL